ncbi:MAG: coproporphyrinogen dehydrogenase HemZ [Lachnospiraceae bacterium]|jgi:coproporphyrinogen dehydrogenase HemZ|nr:coproporphyrinogen dehydrogenase HemZ [Lachnospiraceae bacterium]
MLTATVNLDLYRYEIHSLIKEFYPEETVKVEVTAPETEMPAPFLSVFFAPDAIRIADRRAEAAEGEDLSRKGRACKTALKHLLYEVLCSRTGRTLPWGELIGIRPTKIAMQRLDAGDSAEEAASYMQRTYGVSRGKASLSAAIAEREKSVLSRINTKDGYSLYIGIPFCPTTCLYCSFTSFPAAAWKESIARYLQCLRREMEQAATLMHGRRPDTIYIGGGTPTSLSAEELEVLLDSVADCFPVEGLLEYTVEAGRADSITADKLKVMKAHGVSRMSVNPQTMNDRTLQLIGRRHTAAQVIDAFHLAREAGFDNINMDIILGLPGEDETDVRHTTEEISALGPDDLTVHSLAIKRASRLAEWIAKNGMPVMVNTDATMAIAADAAKNMGLFPYYLYRQKNMAGNFENVGYAKPGKYGIYNILIMEEVQTVFAIGAGAVTKAVFPDGRIERCDNCKDVATYMENLDEMLARREKLFSGIAEQEGNSKK